MSREESKGFASDEIRYYEGLSKRLNCFITVEKGKEKIEFWGPYYNYADWTKGEKRNEPSTNRTD